MNFRKYASLALAAMVAAAGTFAYAQDVVPDPALSALSHEEMVSMRQDLMKANGGLLRSAGSLTGADAVAAADTLIVNYTNLSVLFPEGSAVGDSDALPAIWESYGDFQAIWTSGIEAATAMKAAAEAGDADAYQAANRALGATCGQCHQTFRAPS